MRPKFSRPIPRLFLRPKFSRPIPRLFFETKYFRDRYRDFFSRLNIFETDTETFFRDQNFRDRDRYSQKIEKSLDTEKSRDEMSHSGGQCISKVIQFIFVYTKKSYFLLLLGAPALECDRHLAGCFILSVRINYLARCLSHSSTWAPNRKMNYEIFDLIFST